MISSVKMSMKIIFEKTSDPFQKLEIIMLEVEAIINSRPQTYVLSDPREPEPLILGHFLIGRRLITLPHTKTPFPKLVNIK